MSPKNPRMPAMRARKKLAGLKRLELWAKPEHHAPIKQMARELAEKINDRKDE